MEEYRPESQAFPCPHCSQWVQATLLVSPQLVACPHCGLQFTIPAASHADQPQPDPELDRQDHLDRLRVQRLAAVRRAAYRTRSHLIIAAVACAVIAVQLLIAAVRDLASGARDWRAYAYLPLGLAAAMAAGHFFRRTRILSHEIRRSAFDVGLCSACHRELPTPLPDRCPLCQATVQRPPAPDFSSLGDGSQSWRNLEKMTRLPPDRE